MEKTQEQRPGNFPCVIRTRVSKDQHELLKDAAETAGMRLSAYARHKLTGAHVSSLMDVKVLNELRRQGGLLKKLAMEGQDTSAALAVVMRTIGALQSKI